MPVVLVALAVGLLGRVPHALKNRWLPVVVAVLGGGLAAGLGLALRYRYGWDARVVMDLAQGALHAGRGLGDADYAYLSFYPNTIPLVSIDRLGVSVGAALGLSPDAVLITLTGVCVAITLYAAHLLVVPVAGRGPALVTQLVVLALVGVSPWVSVPYTDYYAMPFVVGGVALACAAWRRRGWGARIRWASWQLPRSRWPTSSRRPRRSSWSPWWSWRSYGSTDRWSIGRAKAVISSAVGATLLFVALSAALTAGAASVAGIDSSPIDPPATPPVTWWLADGMNEQPLPMVACSTAPTTDMVEAVEGRPPARDDGLRPVLHRGPLGGAGLGGMIAFYANKAAWNWGDGMFWAWGEGPDSRPGAVVPHSGVSEAVNAVNGLHGQWYHLRANLPKASGSRSCSWPGSGLLRTAPVRRETLILAVTVLGIAAFTLAFQGRSRYLFAFVPVIVSLAAMVRTRLHPGSVLEPRAPSPPRQVGPLSAEEAVAVHAEHLGMLDQSVRALSLGAPEHFGHGAALRGSW